MLGQYLKFVLGDDSATQKPGEQGFPLADHVTHSDRIQEVLPIFDIQNNIYCVVQSKCLSFIKGWPAGMRCLCCSAETAVQKEDAPEQIGWTRAACKWHSTVTLQACLGHT